MTSAFIALRYLVSPGRHRAVNIISMVAMAGVAVASMAIIVVLSVFNGFSDLARRHLSQIDPEVLIRPADGKAIYSADSLARALTARPDIACASPVLQERALLVGGDGEQMPVVVKAMEYAGAEAVTSPSGMIIDGIFTDSVPVPVYGGRESAAMQTSVGVAVNMGMRPVSFPSAELYVPRRLGRINPANPAAAYRMLAVTMTGVFRVDQPEYDADYIFIPIDRFCSLLEYPPGTATAIEVKAQAGVRTNALIASLKSAMPGYDILGRDMQQADTFRMIAVEKWVTFLMLVFILIIACFNIVSTLSLIVIEKRGDMRTLLALGAPHGMVRGIFIWLGALITAIGGIGGVVLGLALSLIQQHFGLVRLSGDPSALSIDVYPVSVQSSDIALVLCAIALTAAGIGLLTRLFTKHIR